MTRVLLTGASGFIATHVLDTLLEHGHSVRITVRSEDKAQKLITAYPEYKDKIDYAIVPDIAQPGAFDEAVKSDPPFEAILHTASPFHLRVTDVKRDFLDPAIIGTTGILEATKKYAPTVKRVVITSSFASIADARKGTWPGKVYSEADWNPITIQDAYEDPANGYRASKKVAEKAAWDFVQKEKPNFSLATICPPLVLGPIKPYIMTLEGINTSNERVRNLVQGKNRDGHSPSGVYLWVDVRDVAEAHVAALEKEEAGGKRFFLTAGKFSNQLIGNVIKKNFPQLADKLPTQDEPNDGYPEGGVYSADNSRSKEVLGIKYRSLEESVSDLVHVLLEMGA